MDARRLNRIGESAKRHPVDSPTAGVGALALWLGILIGLGLLDLADRGRSGASFRGHVTVIPAVEGAPGLAVDTSPPMPHPGQLRAIPGLGRARAIAVSRALWEAGPDLDLESLHGVGPKSAKAIRSTLFTRSSSRGPLSSYNRRAPYPPQVFASPGTLQGPPSNRCP